MSKHIIHVGYHKAASTYFQKSVLPQLSEEYYVVPPLLYNLSEYRPLGASGELAPQFCLVKRLMSELHKYRYGNRESIFFEEEGKVKAFVGDVSEYVRRFHRPALISNEELVGYFMSEERFVSYFDEIFDKPNYLVFIREQNALINSLLPGRRAHAATEIQFKQGNLPENFSNDVNIDKFLDPRTETLMNHFRHQKFQTVWLKQYDYSELWQSFEGRRLHATPFEQLIRDDPVLINFFGVRLDLSTPTETNPRASIYTSKIGFVLGFLIRKAFDFFPSILCVNLNYRLHGFLVRLDRLIYRNMPELYFKENLLKEDFSDFYAESNRQVDERVVYDLQALGYVRL